MPTTSDLHVLDDWEEEVHGLRHPLRQRLIRERGRYWLQGFANGKWIALSGGPEVNAHLGRRVEALLEAMKRFGVAMPAPTSPPEGAGDA